MSLKKTYSPQRAPCHLIFRSREFHSIDSILPDSWSAILSFLKEVSAKREIYFHICVLMETHLHLIATGPDIESALAQIHAGLEERLSVELEMTKVPIGHRKQFEITSKYIYRNPVQAKITRRVEDYPFSTIQQILGTRENQLPVYDNLGLVSGGHRILNWLNGPISDFENQFLDSNSLGISNQRLDSPHAL